MQTKKRMSLSLADAGKDTKEATGRFTHGVAKATDAATNILVSIVVNTIGIVLSLAGEILTWIARKPVSAILMGLVGGSGALVVKNTHITDNQPGVDWGGIKQDISLVYDNVETSVLNHDYSSISLPEIKIPSFSASKPEMAAHKIVNPEPAVPDRETRPSSRKDHLGDFMRERGIILTYKVRKSAWHTARINNLSFLPGSDVRETLKNCAVVQKGSYIEFSNNTDGFVTGCQPVR